MKNKTQVSYEIYCDFTAVKCQFSDGNKCGVFFFLFLGSINSWYSFEPPINVGLTTSRLCFELNNNKHL